MTIIITIIITILIIYVMNSMITEICIARASLLAPTGNNNWKESSVTVFIRLSAHPLGRKS